MENIHPFFDPDVKISDLGLEDKVIYNIASELSKISYKIPDAIYTILGTHIIRDYIVPTNPRSKNPIFKKRGGPTPNIHNIVKVSPANLNHAINMRKGLIGSHLPGAIIFNTLLCIAFISVLKGGDSSIFALPFIFLPGIMDNGTILVQMHTSKRIYKILDKKQELAERRKT